MRLTMAPDTGIIVEMVCTIAHHVQVTVPPDQDDAGRKLEHPLSSMLRYWRYYAELPVTPAAGMQFAFNEVGADITKDALPILMSTSIQKVVLEETGRVRVQLDHFSLSLADRNIQWREAYIRPVLDFAGVESPEQHERFVTFLEDQLSLAGWSRARQ